jgi:hypothetical protein
MSGREVTPSKVAEPDADRSGSGGGGGLQPWKIALAVILPVLVVALLAFQVRMASIRLVAPSSSTEVYVAHASRR